jgi:hypothetical protein
LKLIRGVAGKAQGRVVDRRSTAAREQLNHDAPSVCVRAGFELPNAGASTRVVGERVEALVPRGGPLLSGWAPIPVGMRLTVGGAYRR